MTEYRAECNFGSRYFANAADSIAFFKRKQAKNFDTEIRIADYRYAEKNRKIYRKTGITRLFFFTESKTVISRMFRSPERAIQSAG